MISIIFNRYLASGNSLTDMAERYSIGRSTAGYIVRSVSIAIWGIMKDECIPPLTNKRWLEIADGFQKRTSFPHCIGAVDGKHIRLKNPFHSGSLFYNYKNYFSISLLAIADSNYCFIYVDVGSYGKDSDSTNFQNSTFSRALMRGTLNIPNSEPISNATPALPYVIVGDEAFGLSKHLLRPYSGTHLSSKKRIFNYRLTLARRYVECTFGILSNKWRIFHRPIDTSVQFADDIVKACCVLHNFVRIRDGYQAEDTLQIIGWEDTDMGNIITGSRADPQKVRDAFADYFVSNEGEIPYQYKIVNI